MRRVVITGMGIYSCIGKNLSEVTDSLYNGKSGIGIDPQRKEMGYLSALTGLLERPDLKKMLDRRKRLCLPEQGEYAYLASVAKEVPGFDLWKPSKMQVSMKHSWKRTK